jgi:hypothetical protein
MRPFNVAMSGLVVLTAVFGLYLHMLHILLGL